MTSSFTSNNKYIGREIATPDFPNILSHFLNDGNRLLVEHIPILLQKLHNLAAIILQLDGFRFYGCSLLMIYDGDKEVQDHFKRHASRNFHRAPATQSEAGLESSETSAEGWVNIMQRPARPTERSEHPTKADRRSRSVDVIATHRLQTSDLSASVQAGFNDNGTGPTDRDADELQSSFSAKSQSHNPSQTRLRGEINLRVVDFAHTITGRDYLPLPADLLEAERNDPVKSKIKGYDTIIDPETGMMYARFPPKSREKPDMGFVFGLKSICEALRQIWEEDGDDSAGMVERWFEGMTNGRVFEGLFGANGEMDEGELST